MAENSNSHFFRFTTRTKREVLLQHCRMASRSTTKELEKRWAAAAANFGCSGKPLTAINSAFAAVRKIRKRQRMLLPVMAYHSLVQKKEMQALIIQ